MKLIPEQAPTSQRSRNHHNLQCYSRILPSLGSISHTTHSHGEVSSYDARKSPVRMSNANCQTQPARPWPNDVAMVSFNLKHVLLLCQCSSPANSNHLRRYGHTVQHR